MANPWFRLYWEFSHDPKVQMMPEAMQRRLVMLLCLRCSDTLETLHETEIAFQLRISADDLAETKQLFLSKGFIDELWGVCNWNKRQMASDTSTERVKRYREKHKSDEAGDETLPKRFSNGLDKKREEKKRKEKKKDNAAVAAAPTFVLPDWISDEAWQGFEENRKRLRCSMTDRTRELTVRELEALRRIGHPPDAVLDQSTQRGWRGVFPLKEGRNGSTQQDRNNGHRESPAVQRQNQSFDAIDAAVARATGARPGGADEAGEGSLPESGAAEWDHRHVPDGVDRPRRPLRPADVPGRVIEGYRGERVLP